MDRKSFVHLPGWLLLVELAAFFSLWRGGLMEKYGPTLVAVIMSVNLFFLGVAVSLIFLRRKS